MAEGGQNNGAPVQQQPVHPQPAQGAQPVQQPVHPAGLHQPQGVPAQAINVHTIQTNLTLPDTLDSDGSGPKLAESWPTWIKRFERYRTTSHLHTKPNAEQVSTLLYCMGKCADPIVATLRIIEETVDYTNLKGALDTYFGVRRNTMTARARFNRRKQAKGEAVDVFIQDLYQMAELCNYGALKDELIRDRIVVGVLDDSLSDRLQAKDDLTLDQAVKLARQSEARKQDRGIVRGDNDTAAGANVDFVQKKGKPKQKFRKKQKPGPGKQPAPQQPNRTDSQTGRCPWCGGDKHFRKMCPAKDALCGRCGKRGHFSKVCLSSKSLNEVEFREDNDVPFLGAIYMQMRSKLTNGQSTVTKLTLS